MQFLIISNPKFQPPPEMLGAIMDGFVAFLTKYKESGNIRESWSFAGRVGGIALIEVDSHEQLEAIMAENPIAPFAEIEIHALVDLVESVKMGRQVAQARMEAMAKMGAG
jgi:muconolactone delta-isomerase